MNRFELAIDESARKMFFPNERIKTKRKILEILLESCRYILYNELSENIRSGEKIVFKNDKMSRLFFVSATKVYSIIFPFNIYQERGETKINYRNLVDIDSQTISNLISFLKNPANQSEDCYDFIEPITQFEKPQQSLCWIVLNHLFFSEDGYIRYDNDPIGHAQALEKNAEHRHPLYHLDIFYSTQATFKLGIERAIIDKEIVDLMNTTTDCKYIKF